mmetsp:Transcript_78201/g.253875  ORF Transcript_78201/g.253875 Transcript_78201/m.253875 type:complete len:538 (+) Transcript_78201:49-1662(+)
MRRSAEAEALSAEQDTASDCAPSDCAFSQKHTAEEDSSCTESVPQMPAGVCSQVSGEKSQAASKQQQKPAIGSRASTATPTPSPTLRPAEPVRKPTDIEAIMEDVRKSEELHQSAAARSSATTPAASGAATAAATVNKVPASDATADNDKVLLSLVGAAQPARGAHAGAPGAPVDAATAQVAAALAASVAPPPSAQAAGRGGNVPRGCRWSDLMDDGSHAQDRASAVTDSRSSRAFDHDLNVDTCENEDDDGMSDDCEDGDLLWPCSSPTSPSKRRTRRRRRNKDKPVVTCSTSTASTASGGVSNNSEDDGTQDSSKNKGVVTWGDLGLGLFGGKGPAPPRQNPAPAAVGCCKASPVLPLQPPPVHSPSGGICLSTDTSGRPPSSPSVKGSRDASDRQMYGSPYPSPSMPPPSWHAMGDNTGCLTATGSPTSAASWSPGGDASARMSTAMPALPEHFGSQWAGPGHAWVATGSSAAPEYLATGFGSQPCAPVGDASVRVANAGAVAMSSWLHASGLPATGEDLAQKLRAVAPEAYED